ncbi:MAG: SHOCT domain-containing protein [Aquabacterium sp.]|uniref:SHOCT domain-containing protein n=1 Tax=Aquabacterium sp. TaxID=1872578 RepID=UPI002A36C985|nr:SHOCT domain-containing protein [Aquabacterium sp.]MDX9844776.1 SHOCT domain-containing protein [Aquabacterium sp.]
MICIATTLAGCAHPIKVEPDTSKLQALGTNTEKSNAIVGYYIPDSLINLEVTTPGGGGDNVRYFPYRDIEIGYKQTLKNVFKDATRLIATPDFSRLKQQGIDYVIQPEILTNSGSTGFFTWPPTNFTVDLTNNIRDANGRHLANVRVVGNGSANNERIFDHGFAGRRAMEDALQKTQNALIELRLPHTKNQYSTEGEFKPQAPIGESPVPRATSERLSTLQDLKDKGLLSQSEYDKKRAEILNSL